jgi:hypothetical protein
MKLAVLAVLLVAAAPSGVSVSFDGESVRVGDSAVTETVLELRQVTAGPILVSKSSVEPLSQPVSISLTPDRTLVLEPGVRVTRVQDGFALSVHYRRRVELEVEGQKSVLVMPVTLALTDRGWTAAGQLWGGKVLTARRLQQDDVDQNLGNLGDSAKRILKATPKEPRPSTPIPMPGAGRNPFNHRMPFPRLFQDFYENPEASSSEAILGLLHASPTGF